MPGYTLSIGFALTLLRVEASTLQLTPPRNVRWSYASQPRAGVLFEWDPPLSFGEDGPDPTGPYQYEVRLSSVRGPAIEGRPWTGAASLAALRVQLNWEQAATELIQIRVRSRDARGAFSAWVESAVVAEDAPGRAFSRGFSRGFA